MSDKDDIPPPAYSSRAPSVANVNISPSSLEAQTSDTNINGASKQSSENTSDCRGASGCNGRAICAIVFLVLADLFLIVGLPVILITTDNDSDSDSGSDISEDDFSVVGSDGDSDAGYDSEDGTTVGGSDYDDSDYDSSDYDSDSEYDDGDEYEVGHRYEADEGKQNATVPSLEAATSTIPAASTRATSSTTSYSPLFPSSAVHPMTEVFPASMSSTTTLSQLPTATSNATTSGTASGITSYASSPRHHHLSGGQKAGIAVGVVAFNVVFISCVLCLVFRKSIKSRLHKKFNKALEDKSNKIAETADAFSISVADSIGDISQHSTDSDSTVTEPAIAEGPVEKDTPVITISPGFRDAWTARTMTPLTPIKEEDSDLIFS